MIDLHNHLLPGVDDGPKTLNGALEMARAFVGQGVTVVACTPHILPGLYSNTGPVIRQAVAGLQEQLNEAGIPLRLVTGADNHVTPSFVQGLKTGHLLSVADSRYVLVEPPHHVAPVRMEEMFFDLIMAGYTPILTHPERLTWIDRHYETLRRLVQSGVWMQVTAGSLIGRFGRGPRSWAERLLDDGLVHILASDAHDTTSRPPDLAQGRDIAAKRYGPQVAQDLVLTRPQAILDNVAPQCIALQTKAMVDSLNFKIRMGDRLNFKIRMGDQTHGATTSVSSHRMPHDGADGRRPCWLRRLFR